MEFGRFNGTGLLIGFLIRIKVAVWWKYMDRCAERRGGLIT
jgi:hypothetical protein